jgi:hypothetical protein
MRLSEIAVVEGDLAAARAVLTDARRNQLVPIEGGSTRSGIDLHEASLLLEPARSTGRSGTSSGTETTSSAASIPATSPGCGRCASGRRPAAATWTRPARPWPATCRSRPGRGGAGSTAPSACTGCARPCGPGCRREVRAFLDAVDRAVPEDPAISSPRRVGRCSHLEVALLEVAGDPAAALAAYRSVLVAQYQYRAAYLMADCHLGAARCQLALGDQAGALDHARQAARLLVQPRGSSAYMPGMPAGWPWDQRSGPAGACWRRPAPPVEPGAVC